MRLTGYEKRNYVMIDKNDFLILDNIKKLEKEKLNNQDKSVVKLARTQLKRNWRLPLIKYLNKLLAKYRN